MKRKRALTDEERWKRNRRKRGKSDNLFLRDEGMKNSRLPKGTYREKPSPPISFVGQLKGARADGTSQT